MPPYVIQSVGPDGRRGLPEVKTERKPSVAQAESAIDTLQPDDWPIPCSTFEDRSTSLWSGVRSGVASREGGQMKEGRKESCRGRWNRETISHRLVSGSTQILAIRCRPRAPTASVLHLFNILTFSAVSLSIALYPLNQQPWSRNAWLGSSWVRCGCAAPLGWMVFTVFCLCVPYTILLLPFLFPARRCGWERMAMNQIVSFLRSQHRSTINLSLRQVYFVLPPQPFKRLEESSQTYSRVHLPLFLFSVLSLVFFHFPLDISLAWTLKYLR